jgi:hypothetical protein
MNAKEKQHLALMKQIFQKKRKADEKYKRKKEANEPNVKITPLKQMKVTADAIELQDHEGKVVEKVDRVLKFNIEEMLDKYETKIKDIKYKLTQIKYETLFELVENDSIEVILESQVIPLEKELEEIQKKKTKLQDIIKKSRQKKLEAHSVMLLNKAVKKQELINSDDIDEKKENFRSYVTLEKKVYEFKKNDTPLIEMKIQKETQEDNQDELDVSLTPENVDAATIEPEQNVTAPPLTPMQFITPLRPKPEEEEKSEGESNSSNSNSSNSNSNSSNSNSSNSNTPVPLIKNTKNTNKVINVNNGSSSNNSSNSSSNSNSNSSSNSSSSNSNSNSNSSSNNSSNNSN